ncbi:MAG: Flp family type IVb pilin [Dehalococcoidia bacterium]|nr:Flp family type IVb pilin [Dehalococcoidia bacterium]
MPSLFVYAQNYIQSLLGKVADEEGQGMIEYALIIGVISLVLIFAFLTLNLDTAIGNLSQDVADAVNTGNDPRATSGE